MFHGASFTKILVLISLVSFPSWGETVDSGDVVMRDGLIYEKFTQTPFTGEIAGLVNGKVKNGKKEGIWVFWGENGQLGAKGMYVITGMKVTGFII